MKVQRICSICRMFCDVAALLDSDSPVGEVLGNGTRIINIVTNCVLDLATAPDNMLRGGSIAATSPRSAVAYNGKKVQFL